MVHMQLNRSEARIVVGTDDSCEASWRSMKERFCSSAQELEESARLWVGGVSEAEICSKSPNQGDLALTAMLAAVLDAVSKLSDAGNWSIEAVDDRVSGYLKSASLVSGLIGRWLARDDCFFGVIAAIVRLRLRGNRRHDGAYI